MGVRTTLEWVCHDEVYFGDEVEVVTGDAGQCVVLNGSRCHGSEQSI